MASGAGARAVRRIIRTDKAPAAIGRYNQGVAVRGGTTVYVSGQIGLSPGGSSLVEGGVEAEARQALTNLGAILAAAGSSFSNVVKTTVFLADMGDYAKVNDIYASFFTESENYPARAVVAAAALPKGAKFEVEAVAIVGEMEDEK